MKKLCAMNAKRKFKSPTDVPFDGLIKVVMFRVGVTESELPKALAQISETKRPAILIKVLSTAPKRFP
jgi:hypothetical protein